MCFSYFSKTVQQLMKLGLKKTREMAAAARAVFTRRAAFARLLANRQDAGELSKLDYATGKHPREGQVLE
jgi:hypothetical protein